MQLNQIFCRYEDISMEQLSKSASLGHTVELAIRTNDACFRILEHLLIVNSHYSYYSEFCGI